MSDLRVDPRRATPPSRQLVEAVLDRIAAGEWGRDARLPSVRSLAATALVNPNTVGKAYRELESMGVVAGRSGAGVYVTADGPRLARRKRRATTKDAVRVAVRHALRAGHSTDTVIALVEDSLSTASILGEE